MRVVFRAGLAAFACCLLASHAAVATADTIRVTTPMDETVASDQACSLGEAITFAGGGPPSGCTSQPASGPPQVVVPAGCYVLSRPLVIDGPMSIVGAGEGPASCGGSGTVIRELSNDRVLDADSGAVATVRGVTLTGGVLVDGAAVYNLGTLTLDTVLITGNAGNAIGAGGRGSDGGAIWNAAVGSLTVMDSTITGNSAGPGGAGDATQPGGVGGNGGGIYNAGGLVTVVGSTITGNSAGDGGDGADFGSGFNGTDGGTGGQGGGIDNAGGTLNVEGSTISGNRAGNGGSGGEGHVGGNGHGGGDGGGVFNTGELIVRDSTISGNRGGDGGNGGLGDSGSGGDGGFGGGGAGVRSSGLFAVVSNTTLSGNATGAAGSGGLGSPAGLTKVAGSGGGLYLPTTATLELTNVTIAGNRGQAGGAIELGNGASVTENGSVIASNAGIDECDGAAFNDGGHNLGFGDTKCPGIHVDPELGPLQDNGGPTPTMALLAGSPAIDLVPADQLCPATDQRGVSRPHGARCDAGAYEAAPPVLAGAAALATGPSSASVAVSVTAELQETTVVVRYGTSSAYGATTAAASAGAGPTAVAVRVPLTGLSAATTYHAQVVATNADGSASSSDVTFTTPAAGRTAPTTSPTVPGRTAPTTSPTVPVLSRVRQSARRWVEGNRLARTSARRRLPVGTTFSFSLNESAMVTFKFTQHLRGQGIGGRCVRPRRGHPRARRCRRAVLHGTLSFAAHPGANAVHFQGVLARGLRLRPGGYTTVITAKTPAGQRSATAMLRFTIVGRVG